MNLVLANDDGWQAEGIQTLAAYLRKKHRVFVVAPAGNRSATSSHLTVWEDCNVEKVAEDTYAIDGYPADCALVGLKLPLGCKIDAVISGINEGANVGTDAVYSGTCAASREAILNGVPSVAFSIYLGSEKRYIYEPLASFALSNLEKLVALSEKTFSLGKGYASLVNINSLSLEKYNGVRFASSLCTRDFGKKCNVRENGTGFVTSFTTNGARDYAVDGSDFADVKAGYISISLLRAEPVALSLEEARISKKDVHFQFSL